MAIIDRDGLFNGDRIAKLSDAAKFAWPFLYLAANTCARLELNYDRIVRTVFGRFYNPPTPAEFWAWIAEYSREFLLFTYNAPNGSLWGQWDTSEKYLRTYKPKNDLASPAPDGEKLISWRNAYAEAKQAENREVLVGSTISENFEKFRKGVGVGVGIGVGVGFGATDASAPSLSGADRRHRSDQPRKNGAADRVGGDDEFKLAAEEKNPPVKRKAKTKGPTAEQKKWFDEFWSIYWRRVAKEAARQAFWRHVKTNERFDQVMAAVCAQESEMMGRDPDKQPHAASWLNGERWNDEVQEAQQPKSDWERLSEEADKLS